MYIYMNYILFVYIYIYTATLRWFMVQQQNCPTMFPGPTAPLAACPGGFWGVKPRGFWAFSPVISGDFLC